MRMAIPVAVLGLTAVLLAALALAWVPSFVSLPTLGGGNGAQDGIKPGDDGEETAGETVEEVEEVWGGDYHFFGYDEPTFLVIQTQEEWDALWARTSSTVPDAQPPEVDFATRTVLVALLGTRPTSGYSVRITGVALGAETYVVTVESWSPADTCSVLMVITHPAHMVSIPRADGPFDFQLEDHIYSCE